MGRSIVFNATGLQNANIITSDIRFESIPQKDIKFSGIAYANRSIASIANYPQKVITISGKVVGSSISDLDTRLDDFRKIFNVSDRPLTIGYLASTRIWTATASRVEIDRPNGLAYANFEVEFVCTRPFGLDPSSTSLFSVNPLTTSTTTQASVFGGTAQFQEPFYTVLFTAITPGAGNRYFRVFNAATGQGIQVNSASFTTAEVYAIDCVNRKVTKGGVEIDYVGSFPEFELGSHNTGYADNFTSRSAFFNGIYTKRYM